MSDLHIELPGQPQLAWALAWFFASRDANRHITVNTRDAQLAVARAASELPPQWQPIGSPIMHRESGPPDALRTFCQQQQVPVDACGQLFIGNSGDTAALLDLWQHGARRGINILNLPPDGLHSRYSELGFPPGTRGVLDLDSGVIDGYALEQALRNQAESLGVTLEPSAKARFIIRKTKGLRFCEGLLHHKPDALMPCLVSALPMSGMEAFAPFVFAETLRLPGGFCRWSWRARGQIKQFRTQPETFLSLLPPNAVQPINPPGTVTLRKLGTAHRGREIDVDRHGFAHPLGVRRSGKKLFLQGANPEPLTLFQVANQLADEIGALI